MGEMGIRIRFHWMTDFNGWCQRVQIRLLRTHKKLDKAGDRVTPVSVSAIEALRSCY